MSKGKRPAQVRKQKDRWIERERKRERRERERAKVRKIKRKRENGREGERDIRSGKLRMRGTQSSI